MTSSIVVHAALTTAGPPALWAEGEPGEVDRSGRSHPFALPAHLLIERTGLTDDEAERGFLTLLLPSAEPVAESTILLLA